MIARLALAGFLLAHAAVHAGFISARPPTTGSGPPWPFELSRSWLLTPLGFDAGASRFVGIALFAATLAGYVLAAVGAAGVLGGVTWLPGVIAGSASSVGLIVL